MLSDRPRQEAYRDAIKNNRSLFEGKTVLDVGAGTGILSVFCALAGAKKVYAVEASNIAALAKQIVEENGFENVIEVHQTRIEDFRIRNENGDEVEDQRQVDIIVSEWMGFYLLHEGMLDSVIRARDKFLHPNGQMFPQRATINLAPCYLPELFSKFDCVDGVKMKSFGSALRAQKSDKPEVTCVRAEDLLHSGTVMVWLDLNDVTVDDLNEFTFDEVIVAEKCGGYQGVCLWFDVEFPADGNGDYVCLSTSPSSPQTHWMQTVIPLPEELHETVEERSPMAIAVSLRRKEENSRQYNLELTVKNADEVEHPVPCECILTKCILINAHMMTAD